ncbi:MAG: hypothetical protein M2R45_01105 [Verrucomicrobia subdivision 3 bacterium]|nr:hypothetical protein [Limisphaerales bacterium]MCS1414216.1 hypothetical protein [Limisphaerales bacterium]
MRWIRESQKSEISASEGLTGGLDTETSNVFAYGILIFLAKCSVECTGCTPVASANVG